MEPRDRQLVMNTVLAAEGWPVVEGWLLSEIEMAKQDALYSDTLAARNESRSTLLAYERFLSWLNAKRYDFDKEAARRAAMSGEPE